ncbi:hypothetical protein COLO4_12827 [Corchorus olitorius]|uniref:DUF4220 domain-containing protein n=1 Tax=Corchorus olitorius TaxID=93759 RepID=A0A1R3JZG5_9ROSI|nr:hypothetical protein COLO4_12827 [Corchorus olitorius]
MKLDAGEKWVLGFLLLNDWNNTTDTEYQHNLELVNRAYSYSRNILNGLLVDLVKVEDLDEAVDYLKNKKAKDALAVMEVELNFMYEILYTKVVVVNSKLGYIVRVIAFGLVLASLGLFHVRTDKDGYNKFDVGITYALLLVAVVVDVMELLMIKFSDWTCVRRRNRHCLSLGCFNQVVDAIFSRLLALKKCRWIPCQCKIDEDVGSHNRLATPFLFRRWSGSVSTLNLISYCLKRKETSIHHVPSSSKAIPKVICWWWLGSVVNQSLSYVGKMITEPLMPYWGPMMYVSTEPLTEDLWKYIFDEVLQKLEDAGYDPQSADILSERALAGTDAGIRPASELTKAVTSQN